MPVTPLKKIMHIRLHIIPAAKMSPIPFPEEAGVGSYSWAHNLDPFWPPQTNQNMHLTFWPIQTQPASQASQLAIRIVNTQKISV